LLFAADAGGPLGILNGGPGLWLLFHPAAIVAIGILLILALTKGIGVDLTGLIPVVEIPLRLLLSPRVTAVTATVDTAAAIASVLKPILQDIADRLPPKPPASH
jgi:hypothetical protein